MSSELRSATFTISVDGQEKGSSIVSIVKSVEQLEAVEQELNKTSATNVKVTKSQTSTQKEANAMARLAIKEYNSQQKAIENVTTQLQNEIKMLSMTSDQQQVFNAQLRAGVDPLSAAGKNIENLVTKQQLLAKASGVSQSSFKGLKGQAQNLGWQLQDVAVQAQMGTSAFTILGQQGSQLASGFGPAGALVGAVIAVGSAIAGVAFSTKGLKEAQEITKVSTIGLTKELYEQAKAGKAVTDNQKAYLITLQQEKIRNYTTDNAKLAKSIKENEIQAEALRARMEAAKSTNDAYMKSLLPGTLGVLRQQLKEVNDEMEQQRSTMDSNIQKAQDAEKNLENIRKGEKFEDSSSTASRLKDEAEAVAEATKSWEDRIATIGLNERAIALYNLTSNATTAAEKAAIPVQTSLINAYYDKQDAIDAVAQAEADRIAQDKLAQKQDADRLKSQIAFNAALKQIYKGSKSENVYEIEAEATRNALAKLNEIRDQAEQDVENSLITKEEQQARELAADAQFNQAKISAETARLNAQRALLEANNNMQVSSAAQLVDTLAGAAEEGSAAYKALFLLQQAFAIQQGTMKAFSDAQTASSNVMQASVPAYGLGGADVTAKAASAYASTLALGMANVGATAGVAFAGAFDKGGVIPAGQAGIVAEYGDELVGGTMVYNNSNSGLGVTGREDTAAMMGGGSQSNTIYQNITVSGSGDKALQQAMQAAAKKGAEEGYKMVATDLKNNRGVSQYTARRNR